MFRKVALSAMGAAVLMTTPVSAMAMPFGNGLPVVKSESVQLIDYRRIRRNRHSHYRHRHNGAAAVAAIIGLGTLLAVTSSNRRYAYYDDGYYGSAPVYAYDPGSPEWIAACARKYRSFNPRTGKYKAYSGNWRWCRLP